MENLYNVLSKFKAQDSPVATLALFSDTDLCMFLVGFMQNPSSFVDEPTSDLPKKLQDQWEWLWEHSDTDHTILAVATGLTEETIFAKFAQAKALKLIFPDGTVSKVASQYLKTHLAAELSELTVRAKKGKETPKEDKGTTPRAETTE